MLEIFQIFQNIERLNEFAALEVALSNKKTRIITVLDGYALRQELQLTHSLSFLVKRSMALRYWPELIKTSASRSVSLIVSTTDGKDILLYLSISSLVCQPKRLPIGTDATK